MPYEILGDSRLSLRQIRVLMAIFSWRKGNTNLARISRDMISKRTGYPLTRVSNITTQLEKLGWIEKKGNGGKSQWCQYKVKELRDYKDKNSNGDQNGNHDQNGNETVTDSVSQTVTDSGTGIDTGINTVKEQSKKIYKKIDLSSFVDFEKDMAIEVIDYRIGINHPLKTTKGVRGMINDIKTVMKKHKMSYEQVKDMMMGNEWRTIKDWYTGFKFKDKSNNVVNHNTAEDNIKASKEREHQQAKREGML